MGLGRQFSGLLGTQKCQCSTALQNCSNVLPAIIVFGGSGSSRHAVYLSCYDAQCSYPKGVNINIQSATQVCKSVGIHVMYLHSCMRGDMRRRFQPVHLAKPPAEVAWILITPILAHLQYG